jgi:hypothetical protein
MNEEEYKRLLQRIATHQRKITSHADAKDDFASVENRLVNLLETAKRRIVRRHGGQ